MQARIRPLIPRDQLQIDTDRLAEIFVRMGTARSEAAVTRAIDDMATILNQLGAQAQAGRRGALARSAAQLQQTAEGLGLCSLQRVAGDLQQVAGRHDPAALAALLARLERVADQSVEVITALQAEIG